MDQERPLRKDLVEAWYRFVNHTCTIEDLTLLFNSVEGNEFLHEFDEVSDSVWNEAIANKSLMTARKRKAYRKKACQLLDKYEHKQMQIPSRNIVRFRRILYTAAAIALFAAATLLYKSQYGTQPVQNIDTIIGQTMPSNDIRLISGEKEVALNQNAQLALKEGLISVVDESNESEIALSENIMNKLIVPAGKRSTLQLADGTHIWLNSGTELDFPSKFTGATREISVKGEIFIEVAKGQKAFYVNTSQFKVRVHGTKFNLSAYGENEENSVVLVEGSVEVVAPGKESAWLAPNEKAVVSTGEIIKETVSVDEYTSWKDGVLTLNKTSVSEMLKKIGRYYNVNFENHCDSVITAKTYTGKLFLTDDFEELMISLSSFFFMQYDKEGETVYLRKNVK